MGFGRASGRHGGGAPRGLRGRGAEVNQTHRESEGSLPSAWPFVPSLPTQRLSLSLSGCVPPSGATRGPARLDTPWSGIPVYESGGVVQGPGQVDRRPLPRPRAHPSRGGRRAGRGFEPSLRRALSGASLSGLERVLCALLPPTHAVPGVPPLGWRAAASNPRPITRVSGTSARAEGTCGPLEGGPGIASGAFSSRVASLRPPLQSSGVSFCHPFSISLGIRRKS